MNRRPHLSWSARTNEATLGSSYIFLLPFCDTNPATQNGGPTECMLSSRKCCCLSSARLPWRRSCMQACILASTLQVFPRKCPLDERKTRRREPAPFTSHRPDERPSELTRNSSCQNTGRAKDPPPLGGVLPTATWQRPITRSKKIATATWRLQPQSGRQPR